MPANATCFFTLPSLSLFLSLVSFPVVVSCPIYNRPVVIIRTLKGKAIGPPLSSRNSIQQI